MNKIYEILREKLQSLRLIPFFTRAVAFSTCMFYIYSWIDYYPIYLVAALPNTLLVDHSISQLFTFAFQPLGLAHLIFALISFVPMAIESETRDGTVKYMLKFFLFNLVIGIMHAFTLLTFGCIYPRYYNFYMHLPCAGLWPINLVMMVEKFSTNGECFTNFLYLPFQIKAKFYPICFLVFWYFAFGYVYELVIGAVIGYISNGYIGLCGICRNYVFHNALIGICEKGCARCLKIFGGSDGDSVFRFNHMPGDSIESRDFN